MSSRQWIHESFEAEDARAVLSAKAASDLPTEIEGSKVRLRILLPFAILLVFVITLFLTSTYFAEKRRSETELLRHAQAVETLFRHELEADASLMHGALATVTQDKGLQTAFEARDRQGVLRRVEPLFGSLKRDHNVTHLYFTDPNRRNFLRVHSPAAHGDIIGRATTLRAERTSDIAYGLEMGKFGTLSLRAVQPWTDGDRLVGYVELGHEIGHFIEEIHEILDVDVLAIVYKEFVNKEGWEAGAELRGHASPWQNFRTTVSVARTMDNIPPALAPYLERDGHSHHTLLNLASGGLRSNVTFLPMQDASGRDIGDLVVIRDATADYATFRNSMLVTSSSATVAGCTVFIIFLMTLQRVERDYRHKKQVEAQFSKLSREHQRIVQVEKLSAIGMMIGEIAHQINNPLVGVVNMAQLAQRNTDESAQTSELLENIINAGKHCQAFVKRMVEFTRISRSEYQKTAICDLIRETTELFRQSAESHPQLELACPDAQVDIEIDRVMIRHALFNLLTNAAQANDLETKGDGLRRAIKVSLFPLRREEDGEAGWCIAVEDEGPGLSEEVRKNLFTPFFSTRPDGTGLGLPVVQHIASLHGGSIKGTNRPDGGARFEFWLPEHRPESKSDEA